MLLDMLLERVALPEVLTSPAIFAGDDTCLTVGLLAGLRAVRPEQPLLIVDGANAFDPFLVTPTLQRLTAAGVMTLIACPPPHSTPGRERFFPALCAAAAWVFQVTRAADRDAVQITCTKPQAATWTWEPQIGMITARRWW